MPNHLQNETSPYLLQHADNPVDWYPWGEAAFQRARDEDKPVFLSIGYSTCHWCHVMARESFMDAEVAGILNRTFVCVKVDREERPDIDSIYMAFCQAFTGSGGWPMSVFLTAEQKPFFAGTYFPKTARYGAIGFIELLQAIVLQWQTDRGQLLRSADGVTAVLQRTRTGSTPADTRLLDAAMLQYRRSFDPTHGGFGRAPKFPAPHNLLFLLTHAQKHGDKQALEMAETTLRHMYLGGIFDHVGYGFCRYSTDRYFLVPHFEKMLYDNALLTMAYCRAYEVTKQPFYLDVARKVADYVLREMTAGGGAFYSAEDADSDGVEGKYYVFEPSELTELLGPADGEAFCRHYGITAAGNFEGRSIPNLLHGGGPDGALEHLLPKVRAYRASRTKLGKDDKVLTAWNALMIAGLAALYRVGRDPAHLGAAERAARFLEAELMDGDTLFVSWREGKRSGPGFLDDYAYLILAWTELYHATLEEAYLARAMALLERTVSDFLDAEHGGFYLYGERGEALLLRPKETDDGALPSGNAVMAYNLVCLGAVTGEDRLAALAKRQLDFLYAEAEPYPMGHAMTLLALSDFFDPPPHLTVVGADRAARDALPFLLPLAATVRLLPQPTEAYPLVAGKPTFYLCRDKSCLPPVNDLKSLLPVQP